jgi:hypothetical protein
MNKKIRAKAERYIRLCDTPWKLKDRKDCDICEDILDRTTLSYWIGTNTPPFFCEEHARELNLLW